jgi:outer membrane protein OmpA-like peptidoglycan-associated protein
MSAPRSAKFLHLQLGQEIIYLLLAIALGAALIMATMLIARERQESTRAPDQPPIIALRDADGFRFAFGSAVLTQSFRDKLINETIQAILDNRQSYDADILEVIGHTDETPLRVGSVSNLDGQLVAFLGPSGGSEAVRLSAADNTGLGMARAAAVARVLISDPRMAGIRVLPMSAGQVIKPDETLAGLGGPENDESRRRIELRLRRTR